MSLDTLMEDFALFDDWEERYRYIIELGNNLEPLSEAEHNEQNKVQGCVSQVWLVSSSEGNQMHIRGDSDAHIVRGLVAILLDLYAGKTVGEIATFDAEDAFTRLGLGDHLTPQRSNGFYAMVQRIRNDAAAASAQKTQ